MTAAGFSGAGALRELVLPVVVLAAAEPGATTCATTTTSYVSLAPPLLAAALRPDSRTAQLTLRTGRYSMSLLAAGQSDVAQRAARPSDAADKMATLGIEREEAAQDGWPPGVAAAASVLWCTLASSAQVGDHLVIYGEVVACRPAGPDTALLLRHHRRYLATGTPLSGYAPEGYPI